MTIEEIIHLKAERLESVPDKFLSGVDKAQKDAFKKILEYVSQLERDGDKIIASEKNLRISATIIEELKLVINGKDYLKTVVAFAKEFDEQAILSDTYFSKEFTNFKESKFADAVLQNSKTNTVTQLIETTPKTKFIEPLKGILDNAISTGSSWNQTVQTLQDYALGDGTVDGKLLHYSKQIAHDSFALSDRNYTNIIGDELEVEFYQYFGGLVKDSREFCTTRHGKFYHYKEVEAWGLLGDWDGKIPATNEQTIFVYAGGFNCRHSILPRSEASVPKSDLKRALSKGLWKPSKKTLEMLNIAA